MDKEFETNRGNQQAWPPTDGSGLENSEWNTTIAWQGCKNTWSV